MKILYTGILVLGFCIGHQVKAETTMVKAGKKNSQAAFLNNYDEKIAALENYTVTFVSAKERSRALKSQSGSGVNVKLVKKSNSRS